MFHRDEMDTVEGRGFKKLWFMVAVAALVAFAKKSPEMWFWYKRQQMQAKKWRMVNSVLDRVMPAA